MAKNCRGRHSGFAVLVALAALALAGCGSRNTYVAPPPPKVVVAQALQHAATFYVYLTGNTAAFRTANLVARVQGYLELDRLHQGCRGDEEYAAYRHRA